MKVSIGAKPLVFTTPVWVITTYDPDGRTNAMTASWGGICCSRPPCVSVSLRKATATYGYLTARGAFAVNVTSAEQLAAADFFGTVSARDVDKIQAVGMTAIASDLVDAPYLAEMPMVLECRLLHQLEIGLHTLFVGEIADVKADPEVLGARGLPDPAKVRPVSYAPEVRLYHGLGELLGGVGDLAPSVKRRE
jgi:flavin reductase (DIM6/NTAB) family NADH-FMN oxidoreductase RutF